MQKLFGNYVELSMFDGFSIHKVKQNELNYKKYFPKDKSETLDIGIGLGEMLTCMRDWGYKYLGVDISPSTVAACRAEGLNCEVVEDTTVFLRGNAARFSVITMLDVLEHIPKDEMIPMLEAASHALVPGGRLIIQVPCSQARDAQLHRYSDLTHQVAFGEHSLGQVLRAAGFTQILFDGFEPFYQTSIKIILKKFVRSAIWAKTRLERRVTGNLDPDILSPVLIAVASA